MLRYFYFLTVLVITIFATASAQADDQSYKMVVNSKKCSQEKYGPSTECKYIIGKNLEITITGLQSNSSKSVYFDKSNYEGDYFGIVDIDSGCIWIREGTNNSNANVNLFPIAAIASRTGMIYKDTTECDKENKNE